MNKKLTQGFTLIELLVVIAIIGILASVVLASLNTARDKGSNASLKAALSQVRTQSELFYDTGRTYTGMCGDATITRILANAQTNSVSAAATPIILLATPQSVTQVTCHVDAGGLAYAVSAPLKAAEGGNAYYCVDSVGTAKTTNNPLLGSVVVCP